MIFMTIEENLKELGVRISVNTRAGRFQGKGGALDDEDTRLKLMGLSPKNHSLVDAYSDASSTYYSASENAWAHFLKAPWKVLWLIRSVWYLRINAWGLSNKLVKLAGGIENLTADQLETRASIARKCRRHAEARHCIGIALDQPNISNNTQVLLLIHCAIEAQQQKIQSKAKLIFQEIERLIVRGNVPPMTRVRALRAHARWLKAVGSPEVQIKTLLDAATELAKKAGLRDQVVKVQAGM